MFLVVKLCYKFDFFLLSVINYELGMEKPTVNVINKTVKEGESISMECKGNANPSITSYQWFHNNITLEETGKRISILNIKRN